MKDKIKPIFFCLAFCTLFVCCGKFFRYILVDDTGSYTRITFHEMYEQDNIDVLFVGSSHCYRTFIPEILDRELGVNTFNAGTSAQNLDGSYMVIREAAKYNNIKHIYLELYYAPAFEVYKNRQDMTQTYIISDYLKMSVNKVKYLLDASESVHYFNSFILARRNWQKFFDADYVKNLIIKKQSDDYKNYTYANVTSETEWYAGKGYVADNGVIENWNYFLDRGWGNISIDNISDDWKHMLRKIIDFCDKENISLTLLSAPMSNFLLASVGNYDEYVELVRNMILGTNVQYYDFNLCREEYFPSTSALFRDADHINCYGAEILSYLLADFVNGKISTEELFYHSFEEKVNSLPFTVFGISYRDIEKEQGENVRECKIVSTGNNGLEYKVILKPEKGESYVLREFSDDIFFSIEPDSHGVCTVKYRLSNVSGTADTIDISY